MAMANSPIRVKTPKLVRLRVKPTKLVRLKVKTPKIRLPLRVFTGKTINDT